MSDPLLQGLLSAAVDVEASFSSPSSARVPSQQAPARYGGVLKASTGTNSEKEFSVVRIDCTDTRVCLGRIGSGTLFCIRSECVVGSHVDKMPF